MVAVVSNHHKRKPPLSRLLFVRFFALWCVAILAPAFAGEQRLEPLLKAVESRYNRAQSLRLNFTETYTAPKRSSQTETGVLFLRKPGRMRWDYITPPGKLFLSDGKSVYLYTPDSNRVEKSKLKETEDMRAPLAFLLGKLNFFKEFRKFELRQEGAETWIVAEPTSENLPYSRVEFLVTSAAQIRRLKVIGDDHSVLDFTFEQETVNPRLESGLFAFRMPAGAEMVEAAP